MDTRVRKRLENNAGFPIEAFPDHGVCVRVSHARADQPKNRLLAQRLPQKNAVLVTGIPRVVQALSPRLQSMTSEKLFSPLGLAETRRALAPADAESLDRTYGFDYVLAEHERFHPATTQHKAVALRRADIPAQQFKLRMAERRPSETDDFIWAFACYHDHPNVPATELAPFGPGCASIAIVIWRGSEDIATYGVGTEEVLRGQGYGLAAVSAATQWILAQGAVAWYQAYADNIPSLRIARRLGFSLVSQGFGA
jgi:RimJ/RimL family protein N-acetyltransferase